MNPTSESHESTDTHDANAASGRGAPLRSAARDRQRRSLDVARWIEVGRNLGLQVEEQVHKRPFAVLGATIGVGFAAGSLLGSRLGQWMVACGIGYAMRNVTAGDTGIDRIRAGIQKLAGEADVD